MSVSFSDGWANGTSNNVSFRIVRWSLMQPICASVRNVPKEPKLMPSLSFQKIAGRPQVSGAKAKACG